MLIMDLDDDEIKATKTIVKFTNNVKGVENKNENKNENENENENENKNENENENAKEGYRIWFLDSNGKHYVSAIYVKNNTDSGTNVSVVPTMKKSDSIVLDKEKAEKYVALLKKDDKYLKSEIGLEKM